MTLRKAAEQALEALIWESEGRLLDVVPKITADAIDALRAALAEPDEVAAAVAAEREACVAFLETGVDMAGLAGDPMLTKYTFELLTGCAIAIRARGMNA